MAAAHSAAVALPCGALAHSRWAGEPAVDRDRQARLLLSARRSETKSLSSLKPRSDFTALATVEGAARLKFLLIIVFQAYLVPFIYTRKRYIAPGLPGERSEAIGASCTHKSYPHVAYESRAGGAADHDILKLNKLIQ